MTKGKKSVEELITTLSSSIDKRFDSVDNNFKHVDKLIDGLAISMKNGFDRVDKQLVEIGNHLDKVEFNTNGLDNRVSTLEDRMRVVSTKLGLR